MLGLWLVLVTVVALVVTTIWAGVGAPDGHARVIAIAASPKLRGTLGRLAAMTAGDKGRWVWFRHETRAHTSEGRDTSHVVGVDVYGCGVVDKGDGAEAVAGDPLVDSNQAHVLGGGGKVDGGAGKVVHFDYR